MAITQTQIKHVKAVRSMDYTRVTLTWEPSHPSTVKFNIYRFIGVRGIPSLLILFSPAPYQYAMIFIDGQLAGTVEAAFIDAGMANDPATDEVDAGMANDPSEIGYDGNLQTMIQYYIEANMATNPSTSFIDAHMGTAIVDTFYMDIDLDPRQNYGYIISGLDENDSESLLSAPVITIGSDGKL